MSSSKGRQRQSANRPGGRPMTNAQARRTTGWSAAANRQRDQRRQRLVMSGVAIGVVIVVAVALVLVKTLGGGGSGYKIASPGETTAALQKLTGFTPAMADKIGAGSYEYDASQGVGLQAIPGNPPKVGDKPTIVYEGAEFCPYCAATRWPLVIALARFGKFSGLTATASSSKDVYPDTPTFTFVKAKYSSSLIGFQSVELSDRDHNQLQQPSQQQAQLMNTYDKAGSIPFIYWAGKYVSVGGTFEQQEMSKKTMPEITKALSDPNSPITKGIVGTANVMTAAICQSTGGRPGNVCNSTGVKAAAGQLHGGSS